MTGMEAILQEAMDGEQAAWRTYELFSTTARDHGFFNVSVLFAALATGEKIHLDNHGRALGKPYTPQAKEILVSTTRDNVAAAMATERMEFTDMYPRLIKALGRPRTIEEDVARLSMRWAMSVEVHHAEILEMVLACLDNGQDLPPGRLFVCEACGNLHWGDVPREICPVCKHDAVFYVEVIA